MEDEQFHLLPDRMYIIRFLMEYAVFLGLDPKQVDAQFRRRIHPGGSGAPPQAAASSGSNIPIRRVLAYLMAAAAVIPLVYVALSLFSGRPPELPSRLAPQSPPSGEAPAKLPQGGVAVSTGPQAVAPGAGPPTSLQAAQPEVSPGPRETEGKPSRYHLVAEATQPAWLAVSVDGLARKDILLRPGEKAQWSGRKGFVVTIGNSEGVALSLNGKPVVLRGGKSRIVRDLALPGGVQTGTSR